jgi:hypothetical protein
MRWIEGPGNSKRLKSEDRNEFPISNFKISAFDFVPSPALAREMAAHFTGQLSAFHFLLFALLCIP